ncbi:serine protease [Prevotella sp. FD3004]|uniref:serine protease n=1 Tax=Prevotella sp. FD3004 TaxID=1408309 RepID=UPI00055D5D13|nr:serine protease [Prevotella sp. FD3004]
MKKMIMIFCLLMMAGSAFAQPSWVKKATKSVFTLKTFSADGSLIASSNGYFVGSDGEAVSNYTPFKGALRAVIIDSQGKEMNVVSILGANDMYDVVKFRVDGKTQPLIVSSSVAPVGSLAWLLPYRETKNISSGAIRKAETFQEDYAYYTVALSMPHNTISCPLINESGEVIGMMQQPANDKDTLNYAISARFVDSLKISAFGMNEATLKLTKIKKELPGSLKDAVLALFLSASQMDSAEYVTLVNDFIQKFPKAPDGFMQRAQMAVVDGNFADAEKDMETALKLAEKKDEAHYAYARMIYNKEIFQSAQPYANWSLDKALTEIQSANALNPQPSYRQLEANILYAQQKFDPAYTIYDELAQNGQKTAEVFYAAAKCKEMLKDTTAMLALLDSTMNTFSKPYLKDAAPYLLARAEARRAAGKSRDAVNDLNDYEALMQAEINDNFYYLRHQVEIEGRLYQQALNDINRAIQMAPQETFYYAEKASLQVRVGLLDDAIDTANEMIGIDSNDSDAYMFLGLAQCLKGNKKDGIANLQKAKDMGNLQADTLIQKYQ